MRRLNRLLGTVIASKSRYTIIQIVMHFSLAAGGATAVHYFLGQGFGLNGVIATVVVIVIALLDFYLKWLSEQQEKLRIFEGFVRRFLEAARLSMLSAANPPVKQIRAYVMMPDSGDKTLEIQYEDGFESDDGDRDMAVGRGVWVPGWVWLYGKQKYADLKKPAEEGLPDWKFPEEQVPKPKETLGSIFSLPIKSHRKPPRTIAVLNFDSENSLADMKFADAQVKQLAFGFAVTLESFLRMISGELRAMEGKSWWAPLSAALAQRKRMLAAAGAAVVLCALIYNFVIPLIWKPRISIAALPVMNLTHNTDLDPFCEQLSDNFIHDLAQFSRLRVLPHSKTDQYKDPTVSATDVGVKVGAEKVLRADLKQDSGGYVLHWELTAVAEDAVIDGDKSPSRADQTIRLLDDIPRDVAERVNRKLTGEQQQLVTHRDTTSNDARRDCSKGEFYWKKRTRDDLYRAITYFTSAIAYDSGYAKAYAGLAKAYDLITVFDYVHSSETFTKARNAATRAIELDDNLAEAHAALAFAVYRYDWDFTRADREFVRADELASKDATRQTDATVYQWYGEYLLPMGRKDEAFQKMKKALDVDPTSAIVNCDWGQTLLLAGRSKEAIDQIAKTLKDIDKHFAYAHHVLAKAYMFSEKYDEAEVEFKAEALELGDDFLIQPWLGCLYALSGEEEKARDIVESLENSSANRYIPSYSLATIYSCLGMRDEAFGKLEKAVDERSERLVWLNIDPLVSRLGSDPRFTALVQKVGLPKR